MTIIHGHHIRHDQSLDGRILDRTMHGAFSVERDGPSLHGPPSHQSSIPEEALRWCPQVPGWATEILTRRMPRSDPWTIDRAERAANKARRAACRYLRIVREVFMADDGRQKFKGPAGVQLCRAILRKTKKLQGRWRSLGLPDKSAEVGQLAVKRMQDWRRHVDGKCRKPPGGSAPRGRSPKWCRYCVKGIARDCYEVVDTTAIWHCPADGKGCIVNLAGLLMADECWPWEEVDPGDFTRRDRVRLAGVMGAGSRGKRRRA